MPTPSELLAQYTNQSQMSTYFTDKMGIVSVKSYEAVGDGVTDDKAKIQNAITAASANGGIIFFPTGTYRLGSNITFPSNVTLWFADGAKLKISDGVTITINSYIYDTLSQIFVLNLNNDRKSNAATILGLKKVEYIRPEWFGITGDVTFSVNNYVGTDDSDGIQKCFNVAKDCNCPKIKFSYNNLLIKQTIEITYFDLVLEGSKHDGWGYGTGTTSFGYIAFDRYLTKGFNINCPAGFSTNIKNMFFKSFTNDTELFYFTLAQLPARNFSVSYCWFNGICKSLFSFNMASGSDTGVCVVDISNNKFEGGGNCIYASGSNAIMNTNISNNTIEGGMTFKSINGGVGTSFIVVNNLIEGTANLFDMSCKRCNIKISNNYFEALTGNFLFGNEVASFTYSEYTDNNDVTNNTFIPNIQSNLTVRSVNRKTMYLTNLKDCDNHMKFKTPYSSGSNYYLVNEKIIKKDVLEQYDIKKTSISSSVTMPTKFGNINMVPVNTLGTIYSFAISVTSGDLIILVIPYFSKSSLNHIGAYLYNSDTSQTDSLTQYNYNRSVGNTTGFLVLPIITDLTTSSIKFRMTQQDGPSNSLYHGDICAYKATDPFEIMYI